jgi:hypothetical protein
MGEGLWGKEWEGEGGGEGEGLGVSIFQGVFDIAPLCVPLRSSERPSRDILFSSFWWSIPPVGEGHSHKALWLRAIAV